MTAGILITNSLLFGENWGYLYSHFQALSLYLYILFLVTIETKTSEGKWSGCDSCLSIEINTPQGSCRTNTIPGILEVDSTQNVTGSVLGSCESLHTDTVTSVVFHHKGGDSWIGDHITIKLSEEKSFFCPGGYLKESENKKQLLSTCTEHFKLESGKKIIKSESKGV